MPTTTRWRQRISSACRRPRRALAHGRRPYDLAAAIATEARDGQLLLVDCLTLWLSNRLLRGDDVEAAGDALVATLESITTPIILVSNEVGWGIVPENDLARRFRDAQGRLNQKIAGACATVVLVAAGLPLVLKGNFPAE